MTAMIPKSLGTAGREGASRGGRLRLLSYNVQAGIATCRPHHYLTESWKHLLPYPERLENLDRIASLLKDYDVVGLQEVDAGSLRSAFINLTEYLSLKADFRYWHDQINRRIGRFAQHSIGFLSQLKPTSVTAHRLPGMIPGRGALVVRFGRDDNALLLVILHLSLGQQARLRQLSYLREVIDGYRHIILMGDFNCQSGSPEMQLLLEGTALQAPQSGLSTFPSWRPSRHIDHILVTPSIEVENVRVLNYLFSDHLPIAMDVRLPVQLALTPRPAGAN